ncbi:hypothetical protein F2Q70_00032651 [Brassica cretica]|uniref:Protein unc-45 homolog B n=1 Tax=Brassica cretica TaxID=69181 RepID=A0A8S9FLV2_BRACR|nr:hypothetical protein F2Q70_00032651 [Brassica cretica]
MMMLPVNRTSALLLTILTQIKALHHTQQVHAKVILHGLQEEVLLGSSLTNSYIQSNRLDLAAASFHRIPPRKRNRYSWNTILSGHSKSKNHRESLRLYNLMRKDCNVDSFNLVFAIKACVGLGFLENGVLVHGLAVKNGLDKDGYVAPSLVEMYGEFGRVEDARKVFDEITLKSSVLWGVLMKGYLRYSSDSEVFRLFYLMREGGLGIDNALTLICLVKACGNVFAGREGKSVHGLSIRRGFIDQSGYLQASVVDMYVKCRLLDDARELFQKSVDKNVVMWTTLVRPALPALERLIHSTDEEVLTDACWALSYLSDGTNDKIQSVIEAGVVPRLVELLLHPSPSVLIPALRSIGNIVTGDDTQTQCVISHGALLSLLSLLTHNHKKSIKKEACWTISNITAGNREQIQAVCEAGVICPLVNLLQNAEFDIKKEAAWAVSNATSGGSPDQIKYMVEQGVVKPLCDLLICPDPRIITVCLEGLENILKVGEAEKVTGNTGDVNFYAQLIDDAEGLEKIENLQSHDNSEIYEKAVKILETYWLEEEDETLPHGDGSAQGFQFGGNDAAATPGGFNFQ